MILSDFEMLNFVFFMDKSVAYIILVFRFVTCALMLYLLVHDTLENRALRVAHLVSSNVVILYRTETKSQVIIEDYAKAACSQQYNDNCTHNRRQDITM